MLGVRKVIWIPTGMIEDTATLRGALATHIQVPELDGVAIPHAGVYTMFGVNGHPDGVHSLRWTEHGRARANNADGSSAPHRG